MRCIIILCLLAFTCVGRPVIAVEEPATDHKLVMIGNYVFKNHGTGPLQLEQLLAAAGRGSWSVTLCMNDIHASLAGNWAGKHQKDGSWKHEPRAGADQITGQSDGRPAEVVILQLATSDYFGKRSDDCRAAVAGYADLAKQVGARLLLLIEPEDHVVSPQAIAEHPDGELRGKKSQEDWDSWQQRQQEELEQDLARLRGLAAELAVEIVPTPLLFDRFYAEHPTRHLHGPRAWNDVNHMSPHDTYLAMCGVAAALDGRLPSEPPAGEGPFAPSNERIARDNDKRLGRGKEQQPLLQIPADEAGTVAASAWQTVASWRESCKAPVE